MKNVISERAAFYGLVGILSAIIIFHLLILSGIIPFQIVWGGRLENREQMLQFEMISLLLNACMLLVIGIRGGLVKITINPLIIRICRMGNKYGTEILFVMFVKRSSNHYLHKRVDFVSCTIISVVVKEL